MELLYRHLERVQESGELVEPLMTAGRHSIVNEAVEFIDVGETQFIEVLLTLQTLNWHNAEEEQGLHAEELFLSDLQQQKLLRKMSHPYAVFIHGGNVHPMFVEHEIRGEVKHPAVDVLIGPPYQGEHHYPHP